MNRLRHCEIPIVIDAPTLGRNVQLFVFFDMAKQRPELVNKYTFVDVLDLLGKRKAPPSFSGTEKQSVRETDAQKMLVKALFVCVQGRCCEN